MSMLEEIRARHSERHPGPHRWFGNIKARDAYLATIDRGREYIISFHRWGMNDAGPRFRKFHPGMKCALMQPITEFVRPVHEGNAAFANGIEQPDAIGIAYSWEDIEWLIKRVDELEAQAASQ